MNNKLVPQINPGINTYVKPINKKVNNLLSTTELINSTLDVVNGRIFSKIDLDQEFINDLTILNIGNKYAKFLEKNSLENKKILIINNDNNIDTKVFSQIFASSLKANKIKVFFSKNNEPMNFAMGFSSIDDEYSGMVSFSMPYHPKKILLISFFNENGTLISKKQSNELNELNVENIDLNLNLYDEQIKMLPNFDIDKYLLKLPQPKDLSNLDISINSSYNFNSKIIEKFCERNQVSYKISNCNNKPNKNKNIKKAIMNSIVTKSDVAISWLSDNNAFELAIRHKKQYKFFDFNDLSAIYLYYQIKYRKIDISNKFIVNSFSTSELISIIAKHYKIEVKQYENFLSDLVANDNLEQNMIFATNGSSYFIVPEQLNYVSDPLLILQIFLEMISFFKHQNMTLHDVMMEMNSVFGIYRYSKTEEYMDNVTIGKLFNIIVKENKFANQKIIRFYDINLDDKNIKIIKFILEDKTKVTLINSTIKNSLRINLSLYFPPQSETKNINNLSEKEMISLDKNKNYINLVVREKKILESIKIFKDDHIQKTKSWKEATKYLIFLIIFFGIFITLFTTLYNIGGKPETIFIKLNNIIMNNKLLMYLLPLIALSMIFPIICNSILIGRMLKVQGEKVKIRHLIISSIIGIVITNITPMSIGGDLAGYWYLRRKSFERAPLIATYLASSLLYQIVGAIAAMIFIPLGFIAYSDILLDFSSPTSIIILTLLLIGFIGNIIGAIAIGVFSFSEKIQSWFINLWMNFTRWFPFIISRDPNSGAASFQYEFLKIRTSSSMIFKNFRLTTEFVFWRMIPNFLNLGALLCMASGMMKPNSELWGGQYINYMIGSSILFVANSISILPGGSGTAQILQTEIFANMFQAPGLENSKIFSLFSTLVFTFLPIVISALLLLTVWMGEKRIDKYAKIKRVLFYEETTQKNKSIRKYTRFYKIAIIFWILGISLGLFAYYFSYIF